MKRFIGKITALKTPSTAQVSISRQWQHPLYLKSVKRTKVYACHYDEKIKLAEGDVVEIGECRPMSKTKHFQVLRKTEEQS